MPRVTRYYLIPQLRKDTFYLEKARREFRSERVIYNQPAIADQRDKQIDRRTNRGMPYQCRRRDARDV